MYCKSPPLTRANLNRSQSVYAKSQTAINRDLGGGGQGNGGIPRPGPLVPAQSLYPLRVSGQNSHVQNQNVQNQMNQVNRSESIYGIRSSMRQPSQDRSQVENQQNTQTNGPMTGFQPVVYGQQTVRQCQNDMTDGNGNVARHPRIVRPESMYGTSRNRGQSAHSDDSSYGSYQGTNSSVRNGGPQQQQQQLPPPQPMCGGAVGPNNEDIPMQTYNACSRSQQQQQAQASGKGPVQMTNGMHPQQQPDREQRPQQPTRNNYMTHQDIYGQTPIACPPPPPPLQHQYAMQSLRQS